MLTGMMLKLPWHTTYTGKTQGVWKLKNLQLSGRQEWWPNTCDNQHCSFSYKHDSHLRINNWEKPKIQTQRNNRTTGLRKTLSKERMRLKNILVDTSKRFSESLHPNKTNKICLVWKGKPYQKYFPSLVYSITFVLLQFLVLCFSFSSSPFVQSKTLSW